MIKTRITLAAGLAALALGAAAPLRAGDGGRWSGHHFGARLGYGTGDGKTKINPRPDAVTFVNLQPQTVKADPSGILLGAVYGYDLQSGRFVYGFEGDLLYSGMKGEKTVSPITQNNGTPFPGSGNHITVRVENKWMASARLRMGYAPSDSWLWYGTAGLAYGKLEDHAIVDFRPVGTTYYEASRHKNKTGWAFGAGGEYAFNDRMSLAVDYRYYDLGKASATVDPQISLPPYQVRYEWTHNFHSLNVGFNWKF